MTSFLYRHHGFTLSSSEPLGRLPAAPEGSSADIAVVALPPGELISGDLDWVMPDPPITMWRADTGRGSYLRLRYAMDSEWAEFVIDERGESVWISRGDDVVLAEVGELLLGPVFSCVLAQRGLTCLHAASVAIAERVVALVGISGAGKSTTALGLVQRGGTLIADDVSVLSPDPGPPAVLSGAPRLRMRPDSAESLVGSYAGLDAMWLDENRRPRKRYINVDDAAAAADDTAWPVDVVYLLVADDACSAPTVSPLAPPHALSRLMSFRHMARALDTTAHRRDFPVIARVVDSVPVRELRRPHGLSSAPDVVDAILADLEQLD